METNWDVVVIGGGPAGMMAAGRAGLRGKRVLLIEKNPSLGKKLLITGGGRSNITNHELDDRKLLSHYGDAEQFLYSPFSQFSVKETFGFFHALGMKTKTEDEQRSFPASDSSQSVLDALVENMKQGGVSVRTGTTVAKVLSSKHKIDCLVLNNEEKIFAKDYIIATGGNSRPETGSTGDGFIFARSLSHHVRDEGSALVPIAIKDDWVKRLQGTSHQHIKLVVYANGVKVKTKTGKMLFTHFGITGPVVLNLSNFIGALLLEGKNVTLTLDLVPDIDQGELNIKLNELLREQSNKMIKNVLDMYAPSAFVPILLEVANIDPNLPCHSVTREQRLKLVDAFKKNSMTVDKLLGMDKAVVASGGVRLQDIDTKTMRSKIVENLFFVGDMIDIDRPSGGYSLQLCWTTGWVAGSNAG